MGYPPLNNSGTIPSSPGSSVGKNPATQPCQITAHRLEYILGILNPKFLAKLLECQEKLGLKGQPLCPSLLMAEFKRTYPEALTAQELEQKTRNPNFTNPLYTEAAKNFTNKKYFQLRSS